MARQLDIMQACYQFTGEGQQQGLSFEAGALITVLEKLDTGWFRGEHNQRQGWFPATYVQPVATSGWSAFLTDDGRVYYVSPAGETQWSLPSYQQSNGSPYISANDYADGRGVRASQPVGGNASRGDSSRGDSRDRSMSRRGSSAAGNKRLISCLTYPETEAEAASQQPLAGQPFSYVDYFWHDKGEVSGFDVLIGKSVRGKMSVKDMADFMRERASIEDQYAKALAKLARSQFGDQEEGTLGEAWKEIKLEAQNVSASHAVFATKLVNDFERPLVQYLEATRKNTKKAEQKISDDRKTVRREFELVEKSRLSYDKKQIDYERNRGQSEVEDKKARKKCQAATEELKHQIDRYNGAQYKWMEDMISCCGDMEAIEVERHLFVKENIGRYLVMHKELVAGHEEAFGVVEKALADVNHVRDREIFVKTYQTGSVRPVDMK